MGDLFDPGEAARKKAKDATAQQEMMIKEQKQKESLRLAEAESEVSKRRALTQRKGGRSLLIATSPTGTQNLGG